ncbi:cryptochrome/photolyase family protein [Adhaeribacter swui]|uniref:Cryptochrome/photolyase family protein n=1 Tax=Adhaeribacter swui TaxID=2086471 RepID=A0A7G7G335_9BACT|nr:cryptochrome/photolyase family protein [Adhaeribacter swui]QNF31569.1 cryptochrome/photolyase family protein [Adhaeribacter swui]
MPENKILRLILGDQLNSQHSWFSTTDHSVTYVLMEVWQETNYVVHHLQKVVAFFAAMRQFAAELQAIGHEVIYFKISDPENKQSFEQNLQYLISKHSYTKLEYLLPDEYRLDEELKRIAQALPIPTTISDTEHFYSTRDELGKFFKNRKTYVMENFYRYMRQKHGVLMHGDEPITGQWNYDQDNRQKMPANHLPPAPLLFANAITEIKKEVAAAGITTMGYLPENNLSWPISRVQSLELLEYFVQNNLPLFGTFQDAMTPLSWSLYHARLSFALNSKMLAPREVVQRVIREWEESAGKIEFHQVEGFVRQVLGWREYMRGMYWLKMPDLEKANFLENTQSLPSWYWTGKTRMNCLKHAIGQSLHFAYAHHIQRLMITGNFALLAGAHPDEVDAWYLGIYIDAIQWVEITNTRALSQFADGGQIGTKTYVSTAAYINRMSSYCQGCYYDKNKKIGDRACPFNSLYWNFLDQHESKLARNPRISMVYKAWYKMEPDTKAAILEQAQQYLEQIEEL